MCGLISGCRLFLEPLFRRPLQLLALELCPTHFIAATAASAAKLIQVKSVRSRLAKGANSLKARQIGMKSSWQLNSDVDLSTLAPLSRSTT